MVIQSSYIWRCQLCRDEKRIALHGTRSVDKKPLKISCCDVFNTRTTVKAIEIIAVATVLMAELSS